MSGKTKGVEHVESVEASAEAKRRLRIVLTTITGERTVEEAAAELAVSTARVHELRKVALSGAAQALEPRAPGRPASPRPDPELEALREEVKELRVDLQAARVREEIAIVMPHLLRPPTAGEKGGPGAKRGGRRGT
jgi:hypothetical protein